MPPVITIYCASSPLVDKKYFAATRVLADVLFEQRAHVRYGGGGKGLMGALADRYLELGGPITGVIPRFMVEVEWAHPGVRDMQVVEDMHQRKQLLIDGCDAVLALPGGTGTLEELVEVITLRRLGRFDKPILLLNTDGFYDSLQAFFFKMADEHFLHSDHLQMWRLLDRPQQLWEAMAAFPPLPEDSLQRALVGGGGGVAPE